MDNRRRGSDVVIDTTSWVEGIDYDFSRIDNLPDEEREHMYNDMNTIRCGMGEVNSGSPRGYTYLESIRRTMNDVYGTGYIHGNGVNNDMFKYKVVNDGVSWKVVDKVVTDSSKRSFDVNVSTLWIGGHPYKSGEISIEIDKLYHVTHRWDVKKNMSIGYKVVPRDIGDMFEVYTSRGEKVFIHEGEANLYVDKMTPKLYPMSLADKYVGETNLCNVETVVKYDFDIDSYVEDVYAEEGQQGSLIMQCVVAEHNYLSQLRDYMLKYYDENGKRRKGVEIEHIDLDLIAERVGHYDEVGEYCVQFMVKHDWDYYGSSIQYSEGLLLSYPLPTFKTFVGVHAMDGNGVDYLEEFAQSIVFDDRSFEVIVLQHDFDSWLSTLNFENYLMEMGYGSLQEVDEHTRIMESVKYTQIMISMLDYADDLMTEIKSCQREAGLVKSLSHFHTGSTIFKDLQDNIVQIEEDYKVQLEEVNEKLSKCENQIEVLKTTREKRGRQIQSMLHVILGIMEGSISKDSLEEKISDGAYDGIMHWHSRVMALKLADRADYMNKEAMEYDDLRLYSDSQVRARENLRKQLDSAIKERDKLMAENKRLLNDKNVNTELDEMNDKLRFYQSLLYFSMAVLVLLAFLGI